MFTCFSFFTPHIVHLAWRVRTVLLRGIIIITLLIMIIIIAIMTITLIVIIIIMIIIIIIIIIIMIIMIIFIDCKFSFTKYHVNN